MNLKSTFKWQQQGIMAEVVSVPGSQKSPVGLL